MDLNRMLRDAERIRENLTHFDIGTAGSGNWGHAGRKGVRGGSAPGGGTAHRITMEGGGFTSRAKKAKAEKEAAKKTEEAEELGSRAETQKPDPNAERKAAWKAKVDADRADMLSKKPNVQAMTMFKKGILPQKEAMKQMKDGTISETVNHYYDVMEANGDPTPVKATIDGKRSLDVDAHGSWEAARKAAVQEDTGMSAPEAEKVCQEMATWASGAWDKADTETLNRYIEKAPAYSGTIYRGLSFDSPAGFDAFMAEVQTGTIRMNGVSSWAALREVAQSYGHMTEEGASGVEIQCISNRTATPVEHLKPVNGGEAEVLANSRTQWSVLSVERQDDGAGGRKAIVRVVEREDYADD